MCNKNLTLTEVQVSVSPLGGSVGTQRKPAFVNSPFLLLVSVQHMGLGPMSVNAASGRIIKIIQPLYQVSINRTLVIQQFINTFSSKLSGLAGQPLSPEAQAYWYEQLQDMQLQNRSATVGLCHCN